MTCSYQFTGQVPPTPAELLVGAGLVIVLRWCGDAKAVIDRILATEVGQSVLNQRIGQFLGLNHVSIETAPGE